MSVAAFSLMLMCLGGISGCGSKPADGELVPDAGQIGDEQKARIKGYYTKRIQSDNKAKGKKSVAKK
jgi:hypothetical protein